MSTTTARLLEAAIEIVGGQRLLAERLGVTETLLRRFMAGTRVLPDPLLLRAVDIILADRDSRPDATWPVDDPLQEFRP